MSRRDVEVIEMVLKEWKKSAGDRSSAEMIGVFVGYLKAKHGNRLTIRRVIDCLDEIAKLSVMLEDALRAAERRVSRSKGKVSITFALGGVEE